jgi:hypothetical protein
VDTYKTSGGGVYLRTREAMRFTGRSGGWLKSLALNGRVRTTTIDGIPGHLYHRGDLESFIAETQRVLASA